MKASVVSAEYIESLILTIRGQKVILDADLARIFGVETKAFNAHSNATRIVFRPTSRFS